MERIGMPEPFTSSLYSASPRAVAAKYLPIERGIALGAPGYLYTPAAREGAAGLTS